MSIRRLLLSFTLVAALAGQAGAVSTLYLSGFWHGWTTGSFWVRNSGQYGDTNYHAEGGGVGPLSATLDGNPVSPLFCLDLFHSFSLPGSWTVDVVPIPPEPTPPPYNSQACAWLLNKWTSLGRPYDLDSEGLQVAMWEVSHEIQPDFAGWKSQYSSSTWYNTGDLKVRSLNSNVQTKATAYLDLLYNANISTAHGVYYQPSPATDIAQGFIGEDPVPEPSSLLLLGLGLGAMGLALSRRRG